MVRAAGAQVSAGRSTLPPSPNRTHRTPAVAIRY